MQKTSSFKNTLVCFLFLLASTLQAQSFDFVVDHSSLVVTDADKSAEFYATILKLKEIPHPDLSPGFRWFQIHKNTQLHLIQKDSIVFSKDKSIHLCLATSKLDTVIAHLKKNGIPYYDWPGNKNTISNRTDGVQQIYIQDPDDYWIEINTAAHHRD